MPDYPNLHLPIAEWYCAEEQITIAHAALLAEKSSLQLIIDAVAQIKAHAEELAAAPLT